MSEPIKPATDEEIEGLNKALAFYSPDDCPSDGDIADTGVTPRLLLTRIESDAAKHAAALKERDARIAELEQIMVMHFITLDDHNKPEDDQGEQRAKEFRAECGRIIMRQGRPASHEGGGMTKDQKEIYRAATRLYVAANEVLKEVHIRNLDPVQEDERKGAPRPPIQVGDSVKVVTTGVIEVERLRDGVPSGWRCGPLVTKFEQIERRKQNLGRDARKS